MSERQHSPLSDGTPQLFLRRVSEAPPRALANFASVKQDGPDDGGRVSACFGVQCSRCRGERFRATETAVDLAGETTPVAVTLACVACVYTASIFDARLHGYDGELGHNAYLSGPQRETALALPGGASDTRLRVIYVYSIDPAELCEVSADAGKRPQDLFDWFQLEAKGQGEWQGIWEYECA